MEEESMNFSIAATGIPLRLRTVCAVNDHRGLLFAVDQIIQHLGWEQKSVRCLKQLYFPLPPGFVFRHIGIYFFHLKGKAKMPELFAKIDGPGIMQRMIADNHIILMPVLPY